MNGLANLIEICTILLAYSSEEDNMSMSVEHDTLYLGGPNIGEVPKHMVKNLESLHCHWDEGYECWRIFC